MANGFQGQTGQKVPEMTPEIVRSISDRYVELYENITGEKFQPAEDSATEDEILERMSAGIGKCLENLK